MNRAGLVSIVRAVVNVDAAVAGEPTAVKQQHNRSLTFIFLLIPSMKMIKGKRHATNIVVNVAVGLQGDPQLLESRPP